MRIQGHGFHSSSRLHLQVSASELEYCSSSSTAAIEPFICRASCGTCAAHLPDHLLTEAWRLAGLPSSATGALRRGPLSRPGRDPPAAGRGCMGIAGRPENTQAVLRRRHPPTPPHDHFNHLSRARDYPHTSVKVFSG